MESLPHDAESDRGVHRRVRPVAHASAITAGYVAIAGLWIAVSDYVVSARDPAGRSVVLAEVIKGELFVIVTGVILFAVLNRYLSMIRASEERYRIAQESVRERDRAVRQSYVDVLDAVTGGRLVLLTSEEMESELGEPVLGPRRISELSEMGRARAEVAATFEPLGVSGRDALIVAFGEALTNALTHAGEAEYGVAQMNGCVHLFVRDHGAGIDFRHLPKAALVQGFSTTNSLGYGFTIMLDVTDRVLLCTGDSGTSVVLEVEARSDHTRGEQQRAGASTVPS
jgi:anti-sigma regulatory factor (Ser/Thr protein kinase)